MSIDSLIAALERFDEAVEMMLAREDARALTALEDAAHNVMDAAHNVMDAAHELRVEMRVASVKHCWCGGDVFHVWDQVEGVTS